MRLSSFTLFALLSVATLLQACTDESQEHDTSPHLSMFDADIQLELVQEWELTDTELFPNLTYFQTTGEGKLIAGDFALLRFYMIDSTGNVTRTFSGEGRGPGEMSAFSAMATHPDGRVATADISARRVLIFDTKGDDIITSDHEGGWNTSLQWVEDELVISNNPFRLMATGLPAGSLIMKTFSPESNSTEELFTLKLEMQDAPDDQISCTFCPVLFIDEHHFFTINRDTSYRFHKFDVRTGEAQTFAFSGMPPAVEYTETELQSIQERRERTRQRTGQPMPTTPLPTHKFMFGSIFTDTEKRLWLEINAHQEGSGRFDLFSESGDYLGSIDFPENARRAEFVGESGVLFSFPASNPENYLLKLYSIGM